MDKVVLGNCTLYLGDCSTVMDKWDTNSLDLTLTSPPYNIGNVHHTNKKHHCPYPDQMDEELYQSQQLKVLSRLYELTSNGGSLLYNHKNRITDGISITPYKWILKTPWLVKEEVVWFNGSHNFDPIRFYSMTERVYWLAKSKDTVLINVIRHHDLFSWVAEGTNGEHTRAFPLLMTTDLVACFPNASLVCDPYMGSGTVAEACIKLDRKFVGIEIDPRYFKLAVKRIEEAQMQLKLF